MSSNGRSKRSPSATKGRRSVSNVETPNGKKAADVVAVASPKAKKATTARTSTSTYRASSGQYQPPTDPRFHDLFMRSREAFETAKMQVDQREKSIDDAVQSADITLRKGKASKKSTRTLNDHPPVPLRVQMLTYLVASLLAIMGHVRDSFRYFFPSAAAVRREKGYASVVRDFDDFFHRRFYRRISDCWNRPINSRPSGIVGVVERFTPDFNLTIEETGKMIPAINLGSYNYLGFADEFEYTTNEVLKSLDKFGIGGCGAPEEFARSQPLAELEKTVSAFVGKEDTIICGMGFGTNFASIPALFDKNTLVISDQLNHASLIAGVRMSAAKAKVFPHNRFEVLEKIIEDAIVFGQPRTHLPYKRIVILVEGIYSMEGEILNLRRIVEIKKKYKCLLYVDEAHSIGAIGQTGRGVVEYCGVDPDDVDVLMGTFTKSFGSIGGYISGNHDVIEYVRCMSSVSLYSEALSPACSQQALSVFKMLLGEDGTNIGAERIQRLADNARYFREGLKCLGLTVYGEDCSPVIPAMIYQLAKIPKFSRECLARGVAVVVVGYPATSLVTGRVRFCVSGAHTKSDLYKCLLIIKEVSEDVGIIFHPEKIRPIPRP